MDGRKAHTAWVRTEVVAMPEPARLPGTDPLPVRADWAEAMVAGIGAYLEAEIARTIAGTVVGTGEVSARRADLARRIGVVDPRLPVPALELCASTASPALVARTPRYEVLAVRWPVLAGVEGEGLLLRPVGGVPMAHVVALPDADQPPEAWAGLARGWSADGQIARRLAEAGCQVVVPVLIDRDGRWAGGRPHREYLWRMAFEVGRHPIGYEVQKVLALVDFFTGAGAGAAAGGEGGAPVGLYGYGEGGLLALHAAALDPRISAATVSGYFRERGEVWREPIYRDIWGQLRHGLGDAGLASLVAPRGLVIEAVRGPEGAESGAREGGPLAADAWGAGDARVRAEVARARRAFAALGAEDRLVLVEPSPTAPGQGAGTAGGVAALLRLLGVGTPSAGAAPALPVVAPAGGVAATGSAAPGGGAPSAAGGAGAGAGRGTGDCRGKDLAAGRSDLTGTGAPAGVPTSDGPFPPDGGPGAHAVAHRPDPAGSGAMAGRCPGLPLPCPTAAGSPDAGDRDRTAGTAAAARQFRQFRQLCDFTQGVLQRSGEARDTYWSAADHASPDAWVASCGRYRDRFHDEVIGRLPAPTLPAHPRSVLRYERPGWRGYDVTLDLWPGVFAQGILLLPRDLRAGERRPVVVCQHGLEGRARDVVEGPPDSPYRAFAARLAERGFITYAPQNPYLGGEAFRVLQRKAHPLQYSLFSFITAQHARTLEWLGALPWVDRERIAFYGLSYGGKTAMRVPALLPDYCLSICSADFNEWAVKCASEDRRFSYLFTPEYDMYEFDLAHTCNYAEMAGLIAPRPFMVERGHRDGVGLDEWVAYEYARVRRLYDELGIGARTAIDFFVGGHWIEGEGTFAFLERHLGDPRAPSADRLPGFPP